MKPLNDQSYRDALKSVVPEFDEGMIWDGIEESLGRKKRKRFLFWFWFFSVGILSAVLLVWLSANYNAKGFNTQSSEVVTKMTDKVEKYSSVVVEKTKVDEIIQEQIPAKKITKLQKSNTINSTIQKNQLTIVNSNNILRNVKKALSQNLYRNTNTTFNNSFSSSKNTNYPTNDNAQKNAQLIELRKLRLLNIPQLIIDQRATPDMVIGSIAPSNLELLNSKLRSKKFVFAAIVGRPQSKYSNVNGLNQLWADNSQQASTDLYSVSVRGSYHIEVTDGLSMSIGVAISRVSERFNRTFQNIESSIVEQDSATYIVNPQGLQQYYNGNRTQTITTETVVQQYNQFYNLGLSIGAMYEKSINNNLSAYVEGLVLYNPIQVVTGKSIDLDNELVDLSMNTAGQLVQLSPGAGLSYHLNERYSYQLGIQWTYDFSNRFSASQLSLRKQGIGLKLGMLYTM